MSTPEYDSTEQANISRADLAQMIDEFNHLKANSMRAFSALYSMIQNNMRYDKFDMIALIKSSVMPYLLSEDSALDEVITQAVISVLGDVIKAYLDDDREIAGATFAEEIQDLQKQYIDSLKAKKPEESAILLPGGKPH